MMHSQETGAFLAHRLEVLQALRGADFPAPLADLRRRAEANEADEATRYALSQLPDRVYASAEEVAAEIGGAIPSSGMQGAGPHAGEPQAAQASVHPPSDAGEAVDPLPGSDRL